MKYCLQTLLITSMLLFQAATQASDVAKEKRWADQVIDSIIDGEAEWLQADGHKFLAIYTESTSDETRGAVIVIHGSGAHPNWADIVYPLRTGLPEHGWATLSIQMPILANDAEHAAYAPLFNEVNPRLTAAIAHLKSKGIKTIVIAAHSLGSAMSSHYLASTQAHSITAFVGIGMSPSEFKQMNNVESLKHISIPILDLYGSEDQENIINSAELRKQAAQAAGNKNYSQQKINGANHFFNEKNEILINTVADWLAKHT